jgi:thymidylate synthase (FAD)
MSDEIATHFNEEPIFDEWIDESEEHKKAYLYHEACESNFNTYHILVNQYGMNRQDARGVLPIDTATRCAYTYSIEEWRAILDLRYYGTTGAPHPNAKIIAGMIRQELIKLGYAFR